MSFAGYGQSSTAGPLIAAARRLPARVECSKNNDTAREATRRRADFSAAPGMARGWLSVLYVLFCCPGSEKIRLYFARRYNSCVQLDMQPLATFLSSQPLSPLQRVSSSGSASDLPGGLHSELLAVSVCGDGVRCYPQMDDMPETFLSRNLQGWPTSAKVQLEPHCTCPKCQRDTLPEIGGGNMCFVVFDDEAIGCSLIAEEQRGAAAPSPIPALDREI